MKSNILKSEDSFYVPARDLKEILVHHAAPVNDNDKAVILAHGITGHPNEYIHLKSRDFFTQNGYHVYRMSFYDDNNNARRLHTTTLPIQANDLNDVLAHIKEKHEKVFVCGHSYGGATTLFANPDSTANAFWDSSFYVWGFWNEFTKDEETFSNKVIGTNKRISMLFSKDMMDHANAQNEKSMESLAAAISAPSIVITAADYTLVDGGKHLFQSLTCEKDYKEIKNADHCFYNAHTVEDLLKETHSWFERF